MTAALALALALLAPGPPRAAPAPPTPPAGDAERAARLDAYLGFIHGGPSPAAWRALGPEAVPALLRAAADPGEAPSRRAAALTGLSWIGGARARAALAAMAADGALPFAVRASALEGAGRLLPPAELARALGPVLDGAGRLGDRAVAAEVLSLRAPAVACRAVRAREAREAAADRPAFARALARCAGRGP